MGNLYFPNETNWIIGISPKYDKQNYHVTELNKQWHKLVAKNKKMTINHRLKNWKRLKLMVSICHMACCLTDRCIFIV
jgi:hypothetical protein